MDGSEARHSALALRSLGDGWLAVALALRPTVARFACRSGKL